MNEHAIFHMPDSAYCFPVSKKRITLRLRAAKGDISEAWVIYESKYVIAQKQSRRQNFWKSISRRRSIIIISSVQKAAGRDMNTSQGVN